MTDDALKLTIRRRFAAPRERVFRLWTEDPANPAGWWGPKGFAFVSREADLRPGGRWRLVMRAPDGTTHASGGAYREIVPPERLVMTHAWQDGAGRPVGPETVVTVTLREVDGGTEMLFEQTGFDAPASRDGHAEGWDEAFDALEAVLAHAPASPVALEPAR